MSTSTRQGVELVVAGDTFAFGSLHDATVRVRSEYDKSRAAERTALDQVVALGRWLVALRPHVAPDQWRAHLATYDIHYKKAQRAVRLAEWDAKGRPGLPAPERSGTKLVPAPSVHQAELAAGIRKAPAPFVLDWNDDDARSPKSEDPTLDPDDDGEEFLEDEGDLDEELDADEDFDADDDDLEMAARRESGEGQDRRVANTPGASANRGAELGATPGGAARSTGRGNQLTFATLYEGITARAQRALAVDAVRERAARILEECHLQLGRLLGEVA